MDKTKAIHYIDSAIRFFFYLLIFWAPYSNAVIESCVITSALLWIVKRIVLMDWSGLPGDIFKKVFKGFSPIASPLNKPMGVFLVICVLSSLLSEYTGGSLRATITKALEWFAIYWIALEVFKTKKQIYIALGLFAFTAFSTAIDGILQYHVLGKDIFNQRVITRDGATAGFHHPNSLAAYLIIFVPFALSAALDKAKSYKIKTLKWVVVVIAAWCLVITFSRAGWLAGIFGTGLALFFVRKSWAVTITVGVLVLIAGLYNFGSPNIKTKFRLDSDQFQETVRWRLMLWEDTVKMIKKKPVLGYGVNTFMKLFQKERSKFMDIHPYEPTFAHNCYLQMAMEVGLLGLTAFLWILYSLIRHIRDLFRHFANDATLRPFILGLFSGIMAFFAHSLIDNDLYSLQLSAHLWVSIGILMALSRLLNNSPFCGIKTD